MGRGAKGPGANRHGESRSRSRGRPRTTAGRASATAATVPSCPRPDFPRSTIQPNASKSRDKGRCPIKNNRPIHTSSSSNPNSSDAAPPAGASPVVPPAAAAPAATPPASPPPAPAPSPSVQALTAIAAQFVTQLDSMESQLGADAPLTPAEKRHSARMRKAGAPIVGTLANLARQHQVASPGLNVDDMEQLVAKASALQPLADRLAAFHNHILDLVFFAQSEAWDTALQTYALLQRKAGSDRDLASALEPVTLFFAKRKKAPAPPGTPNKRTRKALSKAVKQVRRTAPQLLVGGTQPASPAAAPTAAPPTASPATPAAPTTATPSGNGTPHS